MKLILDPQPFFLCRYAELAGMDVTAKADVSTCAADAMTWAVASGLVNGVGSNTLPPQVRRHPDTGCHRAYETPG